MNTINPILEHNISLIETLDNFIKNEVEKGLKVTTPFIGGVKKSFHVIENEIIGHINSPHDEWPAHLNVKQRPSLNDMLYHILENDCGPYVNFMPEKKINRENISLKRIYNDSNMEFVTNWDYIYSRVEHPPLEFYEITLVEPKIQFKILDNESNIRNSHLDEWVEIDMDKVMKELNFGVIDDTSPIKSNDFKITLNNNKMHQFLSKLWGLNEWSDPIDHIPKQRLKDFKQKLINFSFISEMKTYLQDYNLDYRLFIRLDTNIPINEVKLEDIEVCAVFSFLEKRFTPLANNYYHFASSNVSIDNHNFKKHSNYFIEYSVCATPLFDFYMTAPLIKNSKNITPAIFPLVYTCDEPLLIVSNRDDDPDYSPIVIILNKLNDKYLSFVESHRTLTKKLVKKCFGPFKKYYSNNDEKYLFFSKDSTNSLYSMPGQYKFNLRMLETYAFFKIIEECIGVEGDCISHSKLYDPMIYRK